MVHRRAKPAELRQAIRSKVRVQGRSVGENSRSQVVVRKPGKQTVPRVK